MKNLILHIGFLLLSVISLAQNWTLSYEVAKEKFSNKDYRAASQILEDLLTNPDHELANTEVYFEMYSLLGITELNQKRYAESEKALRIAAEHYLHTEYNQTALLTFSYYGNLLFALNNYGEASVVFDSAATCSKSLSGLSETYLSLVKNAGVSYYKHGSYTKAKRQFLIIHTELEHEGKWPSIDPAENQLNMGLCALAVSNYSDAIKCFQNAAQSTTPTTTTSTRHEILRKSGLTYSYQNDYAKAEAQYQQLLELQKPNSEAYLTTLLDLSTVYKLSERHYLITELLESVTTSSIDNPQLVSQLYRMLGDAQRLSGRYSAALESYESAKNTLKKADLDRSDEYGQILNGLALLHDALGNFEESEDYYQQDLEIITTTTGAESAEYAQSLSNLGLLYLKMARYSQAEALLTNSLTLRKELNNAPEKVVEALNNLAFVYLKLGQLDRAEQLYQKARSQSESLGIEQTAGYAAILSNLGSIAEQQNNYPSAEKHYTKALNITTEVLGKNHPQYGNAINNLALLAQYQNHYPRATKLYQEYLSFTEDKLGKDHPNYATGLINYGQLLEREEKYSEAKSVYRQALAIRKSALGNAHPDYNNAIHHLCRVLTVLEEYGEADRLWRQIISNYHEQIDEYFPFLSEKERRQFYYVIKEEIEQFNAYALLRFEQNPSLLELVYDNQLKTKALLLNSRNKVKQRIAESNDTELQQTYSDWLQLRESYADAYALTVSERLARKINLDSLHNNINDLEKQLSSSSQAFRSSSEKRNITWKSVRRKLGDREAAVEMIRMTAYDFSKGGTYTKNDVRYLALIVSAENRHGPDLVVLKNGFELEGRLANYYRNATRYAVDDEFSYINYWQPIREKLIGIEKVFLAPDKIYNKINLNSIRNHSTGQFVVDELTLKYLTSTRDLVLSNTSKSKPNKIVLIGNPAFNRSKAPHAHSIKHLPGTQKEVEHIANITHAHGWTIEIDTADMADEEHIKNIKNADVIHIATHGFFETDIDFDGASNSKVHLMESPLLHSGLYLAGAEETLNSDSPHHGEDGILTAYEAMNLHLPNTELIVLSACETGQGSIRNGEAVYGLQRAFMEAGAQSLIVSLWKVNDEATDALMTSFYRHWLTSGDKTFAFRQAQQELRKTYYEPYFWGAFILVGAT